MLPRTGFLVLCLVGCSLAAQAYDARTNYILHCQGCHGASGHIGTLHTVPPLAGSVGWFARLPEGRAYLAQVPGASQAPISDAELAAVLTYMVQRFSAAEAGPDFAAFTEGEVRAVRRLRPDVVALRADLLARIRQEFGVSLWTDAYPAPDAPR